MGDSVRYNGRPRPSFEGDRDSDSRVVQGGPLLFDADESAEGPPKKQKSLLQRAARHMVLDNLYVIAPLIFFSSLAVGIAYYMYANGWDFLLAYYYAASVLLGALYMVPSEPPSPYSTVFTQWYFLWGTSLIMGAIAAMANEVLARASRVAADERKKIILAMDQSPQDEDTSSDWNEVLQTKRSELLHWMGWHDHRGRYIVVAVALLCYAMGVAYGLAFEGWDLRRALFFSLSAMSASGISPPPCDDGDAFTCRPGPLRCMLVGTFLIIAVPTFTYTMGQFAEILVERAIRARERALMMRPLSDSEFRFAIELQGGLRSEFDVPADQMTENPFARVASFSQEVRLDLGDFIVLELLRLKKITKHDLEYIKDLFDMLDADGDGVLIRPAVHTRRPFSSFDLTSAQLDRRTADLMESRLQNDRAVLTPIREGSFESLPAGSCKRPSSFSMVRMSSRLSNEVIPTGDDDEDLGLSTRSVRDEDEDDYQSISGQEPADADAEPTDEEAQAEADRLGSISLGYNSLIIPVMKQMSMRSSAKMRTVQRSRTRRSTVYTMQGLARSPSEVSNATSTASAVSARRRRSLTISPADTERAPLLFAGGTVKRYSSESSLLSEQV